MTFIIQMECEKRRCRCRRLRRWARASYWLVLLAMLKARPRRQGCWIVSYQFNFLCCFFIVVRCPGLAICKKCHLFVYLLLKKKQQQRVQTNGPKLPTCLVPVRLLSRPIRSTHFERVSETNTRSDHVTRKA